MREVRLLSAAPRLVLACVIALTLSGCTDGSDNAVGREDLGIDHLVVGTSVLEDGTEQMRQMTGVAPEFGGRHPGRGTQNALMGLGPRQYLELLAPVQDEQLNQSGSFLAELSDLTPLFWAVSTSDIDRTVQRLKAAGYQVTTPESGSRVQPDGTILKWRTSEIHGPGMELAPFFIEWGEGSVHPAKTSPGGCRLSSLELAALNPQDLEALVQTLGLDVKVKAGKRSAIRIALDCPKGSVALGD
jgi:hypothetical protein